MNEVHIKLSMDEWREIWNKLDKLQTFLMTKAPERASELGQIIDKLVHS